MSRLPTFEHSPEDNTVTVTHPFYGIEDYIEIRAGQLTALLAVLHAYKFADGDISKEILQGLAEGLACEVSGAVEVFTRSAHLLGTAGDLHV